MTKKTRTFLFVACLILFLLVAPCVILYSQGYRLDFNPPAGGIKITQTGGLFLKISPKNAQIYVDGKLKKETSVFTGSALIENLLPKTYAIEIKKGGYHPWKKNLEVKERQVTEAKNITLFPENPKFETLIKNVNDFWFSPDGKKIVIYEPGEKAWALKLYELEKNLKSHLIDEKDIYPKGADLINLKFSQDSKEIYLKVGVKEGERNFALKLDEFSPILIEREIPPVPEEIIAFEKFNNKFYYLDNSGYVFQTDSPPGSFQKGGELKINEKTFPVQPETEYKLRIFQDYIFLEENKTLYLFNPNSKSFEKFFENARDLKISSDLNKLAFFSKSEIWILFLKDCDSPPIHQKGDRVFLTRFSEEINNVFWLNSNYLILNSGGKIKIAEIDDRDGINIISFREFEQAKIFFNKTDKKLYILSNKNLYNSNSLFP